MVKPLKHWSPPSLNLLNYGITAGSVLLCALALPLRFPGLELAGISPHWLLIWVVTWSVKRSPLQGAIAGLCLGLIQDGLTAPQPTHTLSLALVGILTSGLNKQRFIQEDLISVALIVFVMAFVVEGVLMAQFALMGDRTLTELWERQPQVALSSALLSSLWTPVVYYPLNRWWQHVHKLLS
ncbi:rod shape-determining protein MreD [Synechococcales cyanobacterium C]|uniref:Rod shape-determining protein MreD n=1 Tax=Petrachloros mirabilis ULC683 TaxID=2781853 RepID=A0A8K1ZWZ8_9CYAN|nr:rod shape-determining protein MreD [Petrachloros mirabilis]NCJ05656.1 rod shape-determining protein MreD [Petrachloros mirabilis ULC683]